MVLFLFFLMRVKCPRALVPQLRAHVFQDPGQVTLDCHALVLNLRGEELVVPVDHHVEGPQQVVRQGPERFLDEHRRHPADTQFQEQDVLIMKVFLNVIGDLLVLLLVTALLQEVPVTPDPREGFGSAVRTAGDHLVRDDDRVVLLQVIIQLIDLLGSVPDRIRALLAALEEAVVALNLGHLLLREGLDRLPGCPGSLSG